LQATLLFLAKELSPQELAGLEQLFKSIDADHSGTITVNELRDSLVKLGNKVDVRQLSSPEQNE
jgi:calcium-dependent protein kinase